MDLQGRLRYVLHPPCVCFGTCQTEISIMHYFLHNCAKHFYQKIVSEPYVYVAMTLGLSLKQYEN